MKTERGRRRAEVSERKEKTLKWRGRGGGVGGVSRSGEKTGKKRIRVENNERVE